MVGALAALALAVGSSCSAPSPGALPIRGGTTQLVTVAARPHATRATLALWQRRGACWSRAAGPWPARIGRNGVSAHHREGDGTTPLGTFRLGGVAYGVAANPGVRLRYHRLVCGDWWDEDPSSPAYNTFRHVACGATPPFGGDSEALWLQTPAYRWFAVIRYNDAPTVPGRGSAMFLHEDTGSATNGCVTLGRAQLLVTLRWLQPAREPAIAIVAGTGGA